MIVNISIFEEEFIMKKFESIRYYLMFFLITFFLILLLPITNVHAADPDTQTSYDKDITWNSSTSSVNSYQELEIAPGISLGYAFGLTQDTNGKVKSMSDDTIAKPTTFNGSNIFGSKINVFLNNSGNYIGSVFQGSHNSTTPAVNKEQVSSTSPDFIILPTNTSFGLSGVNASKYALLGGTSNTPYMQNKKFYIGKDSNGHTAYKIVGDFIRGSGTGNDVFNLKAEIVLRASPTNSAIVQRELFLSNNSSKAQSFQILYGEDTKLADNDRVLVRDLGNSNGLYIENGTYKLMVTNEMPDGFKYYAGQTFNTSMNWISGFDSKTGAGAESKGYKYGDAITGSASLADSSYTLKWDPTTLNPGETAHFGSTMGVTASPYALPVVSKTYTNQSTNSGTNNIGDKLKFSLKVRNNGYGSSWTYEKLKDTIPDGLQIDPTSIVLTYNDGSSIPINASDYDASTKTLTIPPTLSLSDGQEATISYNASITREGSGKTLTNTAYFTGHDTKTSSKTYDASVDIPVKKSKFNFSFKKYVKNVTNGETGFSTSTDAKVGDIVDFYMIYQVTSDSTDSLNAGTELTDDLPNGLVLDGKVHVKGPQDTTPYESSQINTGINAVSPGQTVTLEFNAKVTSAAVGQVTNVATVSGGVSSSNEVIGDMVSNGASVNVQKSDAFVEVPSLIDFGSTNIYGKKMILNNVTTKGELIVTHPDSNSFNVNVSYDNNNSKTQMKNYNNDTLQADDSGLLFIRQRTNKYTDTGTWQPLTASGVSIQTDTFPGSQDNLNLSDYVGVNDWQIHLAPGTAAGDYTGTLSWNLVESV